MILFLKSAPDADEQMPLTEKLILIFKQRIKDAKTGPGEGGARPRKVRGGYVG